MRLQKINAIDQAVTDFIFAGQPHKTLPRLRTILFLLEEEGLDGVDRARAYYDAYGIALMSDDTARARLFAERAYVIWQEIEGNDSPTTLKVEQCIAALPRNNARLTSATNIECWLWLLPEHRRVTAVQLRPPPITCMSSALNWQRLINSLPLELRQQAQSDARACHIRGRAGQKVSGDGGVMERL